MVIALIFLLLAAFGLFIYVMPIIMGIVTIMLCKKNMPAWWILITTLVSVGTTVMLHEDIFYNADFGPIPLIIMGVYCLISFCVSKARPVEKDDLLHSYYNDENLPYSSFKDNGLTECGVNGLPYSYVAANGDIWNWEAYESWEDYPFPKEDIEHTYCLVQLSDGKKFYYRTRNPDIKVGDNVIVPFGYKYERISGEVLSIKTYDAYSVPYPLEKTKHIVSKIE